MSFKIRIKTLEGEKLTFHAVKEYQANGGLITFLDSRTGKIKIFSTSNCEIEPEVL